MIALLASDLPYRVNAKHRVNTVVTEHHHEKEFHATRPTRASVRYRQARRLGFAAETQDVMDSQSALAELQATRDLSILTLSLPFVDTLNADGSFQPKRDSNASSPDGREGATPLVLAADLTHYQELFSKLRFSYVEQVTKERFLRAITAEQPDFVDPNENVELENKLKIDKASLKERKEEVRELVRELEEQARSLASRKSNRFDAEVSMTTDLE